jgi:SAM-dependent methyltransferase
MRGAKKFEEFKRGFKWRIFGKSNYGKLWSSENYDWYHNIHNSNYLIHENFKEYFSQKKDVKTVLEVGCGYGIYPIENKELFNNLQYTGFDISQQAIDYCKQKSDFEFICGDFIKIQWNRKFDLVFSHAVIDHVYNINGFLSKIIESTKKYAYINSYRGYFNELKNHKQNWFENEGIYYNDISVQETREILLGCGLNEDEFIISSQKSGQSDKNLDVQLCIEIQKKMCN